MIGDLTNIQRQLETLETENPGSLPFVRKIRYFISEIRLDMIKRLLKTYLEE